MRKSLKDQENSSPDAMVTNSTHEATPTQPALAPPPVCEVLRLETCHSVPSLLSEVVCVRCVAQILLVSTYGVGDGPGYIRKLA